MPVDVADLLRPLATAATAEEYLSSQAACLQALAGSEEPLCSLASNSAAEQSLRFEALQALFWLSPPDLPTFLLQLSSSDTDPSVQEAARAVLFRCEVRRSVATDHPERLAVYLDSTRHEYAKWLFSAPPA